MDIKDKEGNLIEFGKEKLKRWREYFEQIPHEIHLRKQIPAWEEMEDIIDLMKNNKNPEKNEITSESLKHGGQKLKEEIYKLVYQI